MKKKILNLFILIIFIATIFAGCVITPDNIEPIQSVEQPGINTVVEGEITSTEDNSDIGQNDEQYDDSLINEDGIYSTPEDVSLYIHTYNKLPINFITKKKAMELGWESNKGNLWDVTDQMSIGGDTFGNREGNLPKKDGRKWFECDVNYDGGFRGAERIVYSNDSLIYYTDDHYETFIQLY